MLDKVSFYKVLVPPSPSEFAVSVNDVKRQINLDVSDTCFDTEIEGFIMVAQAKAESYTNSIIMPQTVQMQFDDVEYSKFERFSYKSIRQFPLRSISNVMFHDGIQFNLLEFQTDYELQQRTAGYARIIFDDDAFNFSFNDEVTPPYRYTLDAEVGYETADDIPIQIRQAIKMYASYLFDTRGDCSGCECDGDGVPLMPSVVRALLGQFKIKEIYG